MIYDGVRASDVMMQGDVFRVTYFHNSLFAEPAIIASEAREAWNRTAESGLAFPITQPTISGRAAVWDVKASGRAAGLTVNALGNAIAAVHSRFTLNRIASVTLGMSMAPSAPLAREAEAERATVAESLPVKAAEFVSDIGLPDIANTIRNVSAGALVIASLAVLFLLAREARYWR